MNLERALAAALVPAGVAAAVLAGTTGSANAANDDSSLPLQLHRIAGGNSGATCAVGLQADIPNLGLRGLIGSDRALKRDVTAVDWSRPA